MTGIVLRLVPEETVHEILLLMGLCVLFLLLAVGSSMISSLTIRMRLVLSSAGFVLSVATAVCFLEHPYHALRAEIAAENTATVIAAAQEAQLEPILSSATCVNPYGGRERCEWNLLPESGLRFTAVDLRTNTMRDVQVAILSIDRTETRIVLVNPVTGAVLAPSASGR